MSKSSTRISKPPKPTQRALVLQGGGALGAYEVGVFKALYEKLFRPGEPLFDIVAGASIGALNSCILVNYVVQNNNSWENSWDTLYRFWDDLKNPTLWNEFANGWWDYWHNLREIWNKFWKPLIEQNKQLTNWRNNYPFIEWYYSWPDKYGPIASGETARRYFSVANLSLLGTKNVMSPGIAQPDMKFFSTSNLSRFSNIPIETTIRRFWNPDTSPIKTRFESAQPRLLLVSVDIQDATTVTFDSYRKEVDQNGNEIRKSEYGDRKPGHMIEYSNGLKMEHLRTSMSSHLRYEYPELEVSNGNSTEKRSFWDGIYLSNTPLRELLQLHRDYWFKVEGNKEPVPDLEIYIVDLYPTLEKGIPEDADKIVDREFDILFHDKTKYDEKVARIVSDYINIANKLIQLAKDKGATESDIGKILNQPALSKSRDTGSRSYNDLLDGRFNISKLVRIELGDYHDNDILGKAFDFSSVTIDKLRERGYKDASSQI
jgi:NTE family protein